MSQFTNITKILKKLNNKIQHITKILIVMANVPIHKYYKKLTIKYKKYNNINSYGKCHN